MARTAAPRPQPDRDARSSTPAPRSPTPRSALRPSRPAGRPGSSAGCGSCSPAPACSSSSPSPPAGTPPYQQNQAEDNADDRGRQAAVSADARRVGARSQLTDDISLSLLLAAAGARLDDSPETRVNLLTALAKRPHLVRSAPPGGGYLEALTSVPTAAGSPPPTIRTGCTSTTPPPTGCCAATTRAGRPRTGRRSSSGRSAPTALSSPSSWRGRSPQSRCACWTRTRCEPTHETRLPRPPSRSPGVDVQFSADGRYLAATMLTRPLALVTLPKSRATRWSGTSAPRAHHPCGCRPAPATRGWRSARTAGPCTPAGR